MHTADLATSSEEPGQPAATAPDWDALYREQLPRILNFFRYRVGTGEAEDLTARVFVKAWAHRERYRSDVAAFGAWLFAIARNEAVDHLRRRRTQEPLERAADLADGTSPLADVERRENAERLARLLTTLDARGRELVALRYGSGLSHREIAAAVGLSESNVGTILHRTVQTLRRAWRKDETG